MKYIILWALCSALTLLTACGPKQQTAQPDQSSHSSQQTGVEVPEREDSSSQTDPSSAVPPDQGHSKDVVPFLDLEEAVPIHKEPGEPKKPEVTEKAPEGDPVCQAYARTLTRLLEEHTFPDGRADGFTGELHSMDENKFAVADVDGDGQRELVIKFTAADLEHHRGLVLDCDPATGEVSIKLDENPGLVFFKNGAVLTQWTSNPNKAGAFWPFSLYEYRPELDSYSYVGGVDAWDHNVDPDHYPEQIDKSGSGFVYYLLPDGLKEDTEAVDVKEYEAWILSYVGSGEMIDLDYKDLTAENIGALNQEASREQTETPAP